MHRAAHGTAFVLVLAAGPLRAAASDFAVGDVFVGIDGGRYLRYSSSGVLLETLTHPAGGQTTGCFCDAQNNLYTTYYQANRVIRFDHAHPHPATLDLLTPGMQFGTDSANESILIDGSGDLLVGHALNGADVHRYTAAGTLTGEWDVQLDRIGSDWIDLAADQCTLFYTSEGSLVLRYDICTGLQLPSFAQLPASFPDRGFALRLLPPGDGSGGLLVAARSRILRLDGAGQTIQTYGAGSGSPFWFALNLDPNGTSFWSADALARSFSRFNIQTGAVEIGPIPINGSPAGLCICGELTAAQVNRPPSCTAGGPYAGACRSASVSNAFATDLDGDALTYTWTSSRADVTVSPASGTIPAGGIAPRLVPPATATLTGPTPPCDQSAVLTLTVTDPRMASSTCEATVTFDDDVPPVVGPAPPGSASEDLSCTWPPNHKYVCFSRADFAVLATDNCAEPVTWRLSGCASDQCDDAPCREHPGENGDGNTSDDCVIAADGESFCVRSERAGTEPGGRRYRVEVQATDACGNVSPATTIGFIHVPHDDHAHLRCRRP